MAATLLCYLLSGKVQVHVVKEWLAWQKTFPQHEEILCNQGEFVSYLLNYIHEEALCFEKYRETPKKVHTPKSIKKLELPHRTKRRPALFTERATGSSPRNSSFPIADTVSPNTVPLIPISPLYMRLNALSVDNLNTPKTKALCLGDFISPNRKSSNKKNPATPPTPTSDYDNSTKRSRRINPTNVAQRKQLSSENSFDFKSAELQRDDRNEITAETFQSNLKLRESTVSAISGKPPKPLQTEIAPDLAEVTDKHKLALLTNLYVHLINSNMVLNATSELYFILTLLLSKQYDTDYFTSELFCSIHNVVYFAVECLRAFSECPSTAHIVLRLLDKSAVRIMATNDRLKSLNVAALIEMSTACVADIKSTATSCLDPRDINVCFDSDTDNRQHFPSDQSFHAFRKQRDIFYEILHAWQANHTSDGWCFTLGLTGKIRSLLSMHMDPANFRHLSRLFKSQLMATCSMQDEAAIPENQLTFLSSLPNVNAEKLNRLRSRLTDKDSSNGIICPPHFPGVQEFYKEFIVQANHAILNTHLKNVFILDLLQISETAVSLPETIIVGEETRNNYIATTKSLQILAKFTSFIESYAYKTKIYNDKLTLEEVEARSWMTPSIDIVGKLNGAIKHGSLLVLIPWLVEYLAMTDATTLRLPYFEPVYDKLFGIFLSSIQAPPSGSMTVWNAQLIRCCLGWLFEQSHFPSEMYFHYLNKTNKHATSNAEIDSFDALEMVNLNVLYAICPFLKEFKKLLQHDCNRNGRITSKHITPVTSLQVTNAEVNEKRLRLQLEESLLSTKPSSLRKTLEFISERVASSIVKTICNEIVPEVKGAAMLENRKLVVTYFEVDLSDGATKSDLKLKSTQIMSAHLRQLKQKCDGTLSQQISAKIHPAVQSLLCADELQGTIDVCTQITNRMCADRVKQWINTHVNSSVFKDFDLDFERINKLLQKERDERNGKLQKYINLPIQGYPHVPHIDSDDEDAEGAAIVWNPSKLLTNLQRKCAWVLSTSQQCSFLAANQRNQQSTEVLELLAHAHRSHQQRCDLSEISWHLTNKLLLDLLLLIIAHIPSTINNTEVIGKFVDFWSTNMEDVLKDIFSRVVSISNVMLLMHSAPESASLTWTLYSQLLTRMLAARLFSAEEFETQCLSVFRQSWDSKTLDSFCKCLQDVVDAYGNKDRFAFLLSFLADYCTDLQEF